MIETLRTVEPEPVPAGLLAGIMAAVEALAPRRIVRPVRGWRRWAMGAAGLAAAAVVVLAVALHTPALVRNAAGPTVAVAPMTPLGPTTTSRIPATTSTGRQPGTVLVGGTERTVSDHAGVLASAREGSGRKLGAARERPLAASAAPASGGPDLRVAALPLLAPDAPVATVMDLPRVGEAGPVALAVKRTTSDGMTMPVREITPPNPDGRAAAAPVQQPSDHPASSRVAVANLPTVKAAPAAEVLRPASEEATETRTSWVSRPRMERETTLAEPSADRPLRLAMARAAINRTAFRTAPGQRDDWGAQ
jgi:hypothetical protein